MYKIAFENGYYWEYIKGYSVSIGAVEKIHLTANYAKSRPDSYVILHNSGNRF
jgi:hypothetical protein